MSMFVNGYSRNGCMAGSEGTLVKFDRWWFYQKKIALFFIEQKQFKFDAWWGQ